MLTTKQLEQRRKYIGGSDAGAILGQNPYTTPLKVYESKIAPVKKKKKDDQDSTEAMIWGSVLEGAIAKEFCRRTGVQYMEPKGAFFHREFDFIGGLVDRIVVNRESDGILEVKNMSSGMWYYLQSAGYDYAPWHYAQLQHYLNVLDLDWGYLTYLVGGNQLINSQILRDHAFCNILEMSEVSFWTDHVLKKKPPEPVTAEEVEKMFIKPTVREIEATPVVVDDFKELKKVNAEIERLKEQKEKYETKLKLFLRDSTLITHKGKPLVSWNPSTRKTVDKKKLEETYPRVFNEVIKITEGRRIYVYKNNS